MSRPVQSAQAKMREIQVEIDGTQATPVASGFDKLQISSVVDNGAGDYTIILKRPFNPENANKAKAFVQSLTADRVCSVSAVDYDRVTILVTDLAGAPADADLSILIKGCDAKYQF